MGVFSPRRTSSPCVEPGRDCLSSGRPCATTTFYLWQKEICAQTPQLVKSGRRGMKDGTLFVFYVPDYPPLRRRPFPSLRDRTVRRFPRASLSLRSAGAAALRSVAGHAPETLCGLVSRSMGAGHLTSLTRGESGRLRRLDAVPPSDIFPRLLSLGGIRCAALGGTDYIDHSRPRP